MFKFKHLDETEDCHEALPEAYIKFKETEDCLEAYKYFTRKPKEDIVEAKRLLYSIGIISKKEFDDISYNPLA